MGGFVERRRGGFRIDRRRKLGTLIPNEIILFELQELLRRRFAAGGRRVLDLGAGTRPYREVCDAYFESAAAVDVETSPHGLAAIDLVASADDLPYPDNDFDFVLCTEVLEHCRDPAAVLREIARVLEPGGLAFVTTPFLVSLHEMPYDYYRFTPSALRALAEEAGFEVVSLIPRGGAFPVLLGAAQQPLVKGLRLVSRLVRVDVGRPGNPLAYLTVVLPQLAYLGVWRLRRRRGRVGDASTRATLGYVTTLRKPRVSPLP